MVDKHELLTDEDLTNCETSTVTYQGFLADCRNKGVKCIATELPRRFVDHVNSLLSSDKAYVLDLDLSAMPRGEYSFKCESKKVKVGSIKVNPKDSSKVSFEGVQCLTTNIYTPGEYKFIKSKIKLLSINGGKVDIIDSIIGTIDFSSSIKEFRMYRGQLLNINCDVPSGNNPFLGDVYFKDVAFSTKLTDDYITNPQPYRNMRFHMMKLENIQMSSLFHKLELESESNMRDSGMGRFLTKAYGTLSDHGNSVTKPVIHFVWSTLVTILISIGFAYSNDVVCNQLAVVCMKSEFHAGMTITFQSVINPLTAFGLKVPALAQNEFHKAILFLYSLFSLLLVFLFGLSVRRKFKLPM